MADLIPAYPSEILKELIGNKSELIIYGHGAGYTPVKNTILDRFSLQPKYIVDQKYKDNIFTDSFTGVSHISLNDLVKKEVNLSSFRVIVTVGSEEIFELIRVNLLDKGFIHIYWAPNIYEFNIHHASGGFEVDPQKIIREEGELINNAFKLLGDSESREVFLTLLDTYITHNPKRVPKRPIYEQYFPLELYDKSQYAGFINCGAYIGDSIKNLIEQVGKVERAVCIEPDPKSYEALVEFCNLNKNKIANEIILLPLALGKKYETIKFKSDLGLCSELSNTSEGLSIQSTRLSDLLPSFPATFISMDLEGAETEALDGSMDLITKFSPAMGISIYHRITDLWRILLKIHNLNLGYKFFIRNYTGFTYETILYCKN